MDLKEFDAVFPEIVSVLTTDDCEADSQEATDWYKQVLEYNVPFGKKARGLTVVHTFKCFASKELITEENLHLATILGWCVELLQAFYLLVDDIMDQSETRRGKLCWYKNKHVGLQALNDALSLENGVYTLLKKYFKTKEYYLSLVDLFVMVSRQTTTGQTLDTLSSVKDGKIDFAYYTRSRLDAIAKYKTAFYTYYLPIGLGMYMAGYTEAQIEKTKPVLLSLGQLFQAQDDYIDCYGDPKLTGKIGTDIEEGKCCWMVVTALEMASEQQKKILVENYGKPDTDKVAKVKAVYEELKLLDVYNEYETQHYKAIQMLIDELKKDIPVNIFSEFLQMTYKRDK